MTETEGPRFVFVGGLQRSGTTLLGRLFADHPDVAGLVGTPTREDEGQFVQDVYLDDHSMGDGPVGRHGPLTAGRAVRWAWHPEAHLTEADASTRPGAAERLLASWAPYWDDPTRPVRVEKSPSNVTRTRFLQSVFPGSTFVVVVRHPVVQALAVRKWTPRTQYVGLGFDHLIAHWLRAMETFAADRPHLERSVVWHYEDLVTAPDAFMRRAFAFAGLTEAPVDCTGIGDRSDRYRRYWAAWRRGRVDREIGPLISDAGPSGLVHRVAERTLARVVGERTARRVERQFGDRIAAWGYDVRDLTRRADAEV